MIEQMRTEEQERRRADRQAATSPSAASASGRQEEGYWAYMQRQVQERTENLNIMGDSMDRLEDTSASYANDVNKYVGKQKKKAVMSRTSFPKPFFLSCLADFFPLSNPANSFSLNFHWYSDWKQIRVLRTFVML